MPGSPEATVKLVSEGSPRQSHRGDNRKVRRYRTSAAAASGEVTRSEVVVEDIKKPGWELASGGNGVKVTYENYPDIGGVELTLQDTGLSVGEKDVLIEGLTRTLEEMKEVRNAQ